MFSVRKKCYVTIKDVPLKKLKQYIGRKVLSSDGSIFGKIVKIRASAKTKKAKYVEVSSGDKVFTFDADKILIYEGRIYIVENSIKDTIRKIELIKSRKDQVKQEKYEEHISRAMLLARRIKSLREGLVILDRRFLRGEVDEEIFKAVREDMLQQLLRLVLDSREVVPYLEKYLKLREEMLDKMIRRLENINVKFSGAKLGEDRVRFEDYVKLMKEEVRAIRETFEILRFEMVMLESSMKK